MPMQVSRQAGASGAAKVQSDIVTVGMQQPVQHCHHRRESFMTLDDLLGGEFSQLTFVCQGRYQQMAVVVWKAIEDHETVVPAEHNQVSSIVLFAESAAEEARIRCSRRL